jgi:hypothetical protein
MRLRQVVADEAVDAEDEDRFMGCFDFEEAQDFTIAAAREPFAVLLVGPAAAALCAGSICVVDPHAVGERRPG